MQTAPLYVHHNKVHTAQHGWIFAIFTVCKTDRIDLIALHPLTPLSACQWNALWLQWLVTHPPQTIQEPALFWPSVTLLSNFFSGVLAFLDFWLLIVSLSLADFMGLLAAESQWWFDCSYVSLIWQRPQSKLQNMQIWTTLITMWNISDYQSDWTIDHWFKNVLWTWAVFSLSLCACLSRSRQKKGYFTVRLAVRGGGVSPLGPDRKQMWKFQPIFWMEYDSMILKTHFISLWGVSKMHF